MRLIAVLSLFLLVACSKQTTIFEVTQQEVRTDKVNKEDFRNEFELLQLAWADLFNSNMPANFQTQLVQDLAATNDRAIVVDRVLRHMLNRAELQLPSNAEMRSDVTAFVLRIYNKFYHRTPDSFEAWKMAQLITENADLRPVHVYMAILSSDEYQRN